MALPVQKYALDIEGLHYYRKAIPSKLYGELLDFIEKRNKMGPEILGIDYNYKKLNIHEKIADMPSVIVKLRNLISLHGIDDKQFNHCAIEDFNQGLSFEQKIEDYKYGSTICIFNIDSPLTIKFTLDETKELLTKPRSLCVLSGDSRYKYKYGVDVHNECGEDDHRFLITFKTVSYK